MENKNVSKISRIKKHLVEKGSIHSFQSIGLGHTRLSAAIFQLKERGWKFSTSKIEIDDGFGTLTMFTKYTLICQPKN